MPIPQEIKIVMIEDDEGHAKLIEKNLRRAGIMNKIVHIDNGRLAIEYFFGPDQKTPSENFVAPLLILLDLNLPEYDGFQVLEKLKSSEVTKLIPVIILTTTDNPREVERGYQLGCNVYITKPVEYDNFSESIRKLGLFLAVVKVPGDN